MPEYSSASTDGSTALDQPQSPSLGQDAAAFLGQSSGVAIESDLRSALAKADF